MTARVQQKKILGTVTPEERDAVRLLFERRNGLVELFKLLPDLDREQADFLYERVVQDFGEVTAKYQDWWTNTSLKYGWENSEGKRWEINFESCEVFLLDSRTGERSP